MAEAAAFVRDQPYSRYPVTGKDFDDVIGFVHVRDLLDVRDPNAKIVRDVVREGISLPGTSKLLPSLELLRKRGIHLAVVIDEYGGTDGIVTLEDMTEELVGDIRDEYDLPSEKGGERTTRTAFVNGVATIEASMTIEDFADLTGIELEDGPYETVAGYFLSKTGKMGAVGDVLHSDDGYNMVVTSPYGIAGPKGMDPEITEFLHQAFKRMQFSDQIQAYMRRNDMPDEYLGPADYTAFARERAVYEERMVRRLNLNID